MAQVEVDQAQLTDAVATKVANAILGDKQWMFMIKDKLYLLALQVIQDPDNDIRRQFQQIFENARVARIAFIQAEVARMFDLEALRKVAADAEARAKSELLACAAKVVEECKARMQRTVRKSIGDLIKDRVDVMLLKVFQPT